MSFKRIEKDFVLSDSRVNEYGFRLLTKGYDLPEFLKNPIGYYMHKPEDGVLVRWEDVRLDGDQVLGKPVINLQHPRGERTVEEIENGFLNAASVGKLKFLEVQLEDNPDGGEPITVITKWFNKECSLVDNPGNRGAMVKLEDVDGNEINLADLCLTPALSMNGEGGVGRGMQNIVKASNNMKTIQLPVTPELLSALNLSDDGATAEAVVAGITAMKADNEALTTEKATLEGEKAKLETQLADERTAQANKQVAEIAEKAVAEKRITQGAANKLKTQFAGKPTELADLINDMPVYEPLTNSLKSNELPKELADKSYDQLDKENLLTRLKKEYPEHYNNMYKAKFGKLPG